MAAERDSLSPEMVSQPRHSRLSILVSKSGADVVISSSIEDNSLLWKHLPFDNVASSTVRAFEELIYDNPLLLSEFGAVNVLIGTDRFLVVPNSITESDNLETMFSELYPDQRSELICNAIDEQTSIAMAVDPSLTGFIRRTFNNVGICHRLVPMVKYFGLKNKLGNSGKFHAHLADKTIDIIAFGNDGLLMANTFYAPETSDALYYILTSAKYLNFDNSSDQMLLSGSAPRRELLLPLLRKYVNYAMPAIFPSAMFKAGKDSLSAPFELMTLPFCD